jgi:hypothetical protein
MKTYGEMMREAVDRTSEWGLEDWTSALADSCLDAPVSPEGALSNNKAMWDYTEAASGNMPMPPAWKSDGESSSAVGEAGRSPPQWEFLPARGYSPRSPSA